MVPFLALLISILISNTQSVNIRVDPLVRLSQGLVSGLRSTDGAYSYFLGIPYAQVDLDNPFGEALPNPSFKEEVFNAVDGSTKCPQMKVFDDLLAPDTDDVVLDCLTLNVYVPFQAGAKNPLPVLVFIHGGYYGTGYSGKYNPKNLVNQGIIVVTINYRLGPYGFLCLDTPEIPGNQGLKDQYEALRWVRQNIAAFGGNPYSVTLSGHSAGAASVLFHLYSSKEKLYNKLIVESGTPLIMDLFTDGDIDAALKLSQYLGYNATNNKEALNFLATASPQLVTSAAIELKLHTVPCKERSISGVNNFIENYPSLLSNEKKIKNTPIMIGVTSYELNGISELMHKSTDDGAFKEILGNYFDFNDSELEKVSNIVKHYYTGDYTSEKSDQVELFHSDFTFNHPSKRTIDNLLKENANPVYEYVFSYEEGPVRTGAWHGAELLYLFEFTDEKDDEKQLISDRLAALWSNFVKYGNPTPSKSDLLPVVWEPVTTETRPYIVIDTEMRMDSRLFSERMSFWDLFYATYGEKTNWRCSFK